jgi:hypothetical protein
LDGVEQVAQAIRELVKASFVLDTAPRQNYSFNALH